MSQEPRLGVSRSSLTDVLAGYVGAAPLPRWMDPARQLNCESSTGSVDPESGPCESSMAGSLEGSHRT